MKWIAIVVVGLAMLVAAIAVVGSMLPRAHSASRTLRVRRPAADVWPVITETAVASSVPVDVLENDPPHRLVTRVTAAERNFGGTWTIVLKPNAEGSDVTITEDGWVANPIFRFVSRYVMGHHATMDALLTSVAKTLGEDARLSGQ
jgi:uncharacterized protein YndB with AHSA1/START domain